MRLPWRLLLWFGTAFLVAGLTMPLFMSLGLLADKMATLLGAMVAGSAALSLDGRRTGAMGFYVARSVPGELIRGLGLGVALAAVVVGVMASAGRVRWAADEGGAGQWIVGAAGALAVLGLAAAAEEALLRGYPLQALAEAWGAGWGLGATSLAFGALHLANPGATALGAANTAAAGLFLGAVYLRTGSLWWATAAHLGWNWGIGFLADLPVSGLELFDAPLLEGVSSGPAWLGGGAFGPEGSVVATVGFLAAAAVCWWGRWLRVEPAALARAPLAPLGRSANGAAAPAAPANG